MSARFTRRDFDKLFKNDDMCLEHIFLNRYQNEKECQKCKREFKYYKLSNKKLYSCQYCGNMIAPTADTIFHKSSTSLKNWFYVLYLFSISKNGVSAKELERQIGVTYKCAWRMAKQIRLLFDSSEEGRRLLKEIVEADETYIGGKHKGKRGRGSENKTPVVGIVERKGIVRAKVMSDTKSSTIMPFIRENVEIEANLMTDMYQSYNKATQHGYKHDRVNHGAKEYVRGNIHTNTIEGFWSRLKRSIDGTYNFVSPKYLQSYVNEFAWRYNHRFSSKPFFLHLLEVVAKQV